jgi:hypothetical protein
VIGISEELKTGVTNFPFLFSASNQKLTALSGVNGIRSADGINDSDQIAGGCTDAQNFGIACVVSNNGTGTVTQLGAPAEQGGTQITCRDAVAVNTNGQALAACGAGGIGAPFQGDAAVIWTNGTPTVAGPITDSTVPVGFNNNDQVIGFTEGGSDQGWSWSNGTTTDLSFVPAAINDSGVIVGGPFIDSGGTVQNLNTLIPAGSGYQIFGATGINDNGKIVANAVDTATGQTHALLLNPS